MGILIDRELILKCEIMALLHDIGKFYKDFIYAGIKGGHLNKIHTQDFMVELSKMKNHNDLYSVLDFELNKDWVKFDDGFGVKKLADLLKHHHIGNLEDLLTYFKCENTSKVLLLVPLLMMADTLDSAYSKGRASFRGRPSRLNSKRFKQDLKSCYLASPLGEIEETINLDSIPDQALAFQKKLAEILANQNNWKIESIVEKRNALVDLFFSCTRKILADTRLPTNDVSLWQHSYSTASIFKAMLTRHILLNDFIVEKEEPLSYHKERLSYLAITWNEDELINRVHRPKDILGRRKRIMQIKESLKQAVEIEFCLGNEIYQDRNGIYFLVPSFDELKKIDELNKKGEKVDDVINYVEYIDNVLNGLENRINDPEIFKGDLQYKILSKEVGIQFLGLGIIISGDEIEKYTLRTGPKKPSWVELWKGNEKSYEICSRCGLRPVSADSVTIGSQSDKMCKFCKTIEEDAAAERKDPNTKYIKRLLGRENTNNDDFFEIETDELVKGFGENNKLALIQGCFDLRYFMEGQAFSSIFTAMPEDFSDVQSVNDQSLDIKTWNMAIDNVEKVLQHYHNANEFEQSLHTLQQLFQDSRLATMGGDGDSRISGNTEYEKLHKYLNDIVYKSAFSKDLDETQETLIYALRQHPAPSRLARIWETTEEICRYPVTWCREKKVKYFPMSMDTGRFMILVPAKEAFNFIQGMYDHYLEKAGRVRHLLPMQLSCAVFYYKSPLYVGIDAMRRFSAIQIGEKEPARELWTLQKILKSRKTVKKDDVDVEQEVYELEWLDHNQRVVRWDMPALMPNGRPEDFFTWFWVENEKRPYRLSELQAGMKIYILPSTFDYEVLDSTARRYDIRLEEGQSTRPHLFLGEKGPRPYPLSVIPKWAGHFESKFKPGETNTQLNHMISLAAGLHKDWKGYGESLKNQLRDHLILNLGTQSQDLLDSAVSGELFDIYEWQHFICK